MIALTLKINLCYAIYYSDIREHTTEHNYSLKTMRGVCMIAVYGYFLLPAIATKTLEKDHHV